MINMNIYSHAPSRSVAFSANGDIIALGLSSGEVQIRRVPEYDLC
jgi:hypothetical protein